MDKFWKDEVFDGKQTFNSFALYLPFVVNLVENICKFVLEVFGKDKNLLEEYLPMIRFPGLQPPGDP